MLGFPKRRGQVFFVGTWPPKVRVLYTVVCTFMAMQYPKAVPFPAPCTLPSSCTGQLQPALEQITSAYSKVFLTLAASIQPDTSDQRERNAVIN